MVDPMTQQQAKPVNPIVPLLAQSSHSISEALRGSPVTQEAFGTSIRASVATDPALLECVEKNPSSVMIAIMQAAQLGLRPGKVHKHFSLITRKGKHGLQCEGQLEYRGMIDLALRSGKIDDIDARCVYRGEEFEYDPMTKSIRHPWAAEDDVDRADDNLIAAYAWAIIKGRDRPANVLLRKADIHKRRESSMAWKAFEAKKIKSTPWDAHYAAMCRKTALRALLDSGLVPLGDMAEKFDRFGDDVEQIHDVDAKIVDTESMATDALEDDIFPGDPEDLLDAVTEALHSLNIPKQVVAKFAVETYGAVPSKLPAALLAKLLDDVQGGRVNA